MRFLASGTHWGTIVTSTAAIIAASGVVFAAQQVRLGRRTRQDQVAVELWRRWDEPALVRARQLSAEYDDEVAFCRALQDFRSARDARYYELLTEPNFFEDLAVLESEKAVSFTFLRKSLGELIVQRWRIWYLPTVELRVEDGRGTIYENFEALASKMASKLGVSLKLPEADSGEGAPD